MTQTDRVPFGVVSRDCEARPSAVIIVVAFKNRNLYSNRLCFQPIYNLVASETSETREVKETFI